MAIIKAQDSEIPEVTSTDPKFLALESDIAFKIYDMLMDCEQFQQRMESNNSVQGMMIKLSA